MANELEQDKNFKKVRFYQDKILLETELNELQDIQNRRFEDHLYDTLGNVIINGFKVNESTGWQISIDQGRAYIDGKVVTNKGDEDLLSIVAPDVYIGDLTLYVILIPQNIIYLPEEEGDKGWEYGVGEPTTYRTEESYQVVIAQEGSAIIVGGTTWAIELPLNSNSYIELARILRPQSAGGIDDCTIRDTRNNLIVKLGEIVNKKFYMKAKQQYDSISEMKSPNELLITPGTNEKDDRDRICADLNVCNSELTDDDTTAIYDVNGNKISVLAITTQDNNHETLDEATATLSGDVAEKVYTPIVDAIDLLLDENNNFENGSSNPDKWIPYGAPIFDVSGYKSSNGNFAVGVSNSNSYTSENYISVVGDNNYIITAFLKANTNSSLNYQFMVEWYDNGENLINSEIKEIIVTTNYKKYIALITAPSTAVYAKIKLNGNGNSSDLFWVDDIELLDDISTANLLTNNSDFENGDENPNGWIASGSPIYYKDGLNSIDGADAIKVSCNNSYESEDFINVAALTEYILTAYIKADSGSFNYQFKINWYNESEIFISSDIREIIVTASYKKYISIFNVPEMATKAKIILDGDGSNALNWFYVDNIELLRNISSGNLLETISGNVGFEESTISPYHWIRNGDPEYISDGSQSYNGDCAIKVSKNNSFQSENFISVIAGNEYIMVAYLKALSIDALKYSFKISWYDSGYSLLSSENKSIEIYDNYKKFISVFKAPISTNYMKIEWLGDNIDENNWFMVDSIEFLNDVTTANLLTNNSDFETIDGLNPSGWTPIGSPIYSTDGSNSYAGNCAIKVSYDNVYKSNQKISITEENEYIIGAYIKADGIETKCRFKIDWYDISSSLIETSYEYFYVTSSYNHYYIRTVAPIDAVELNIVLDGDGLDSDNWFWFDSIEVYDYDEGATNLISTENSNFEDSDPDEWTRNGSPIYGHDSYEGNDSIKVSFGNSYLSNKFIVIDDNNEYVLGARIKADGVAKECRLTINWYDSGYSLLGTSYEKIIVTSNYKHYYIKVTPINNSVYAKVLLEGDGTSGSNWFWYDNIEFYCYDSEIANLIFNNSFEMDNIENWSTSGSPEYSINGLNSYSGNCAIKVSNENSCKSDQFISVLENNEYIIGAYIKANGLATQSRLLVEWYDEYYDLISSSYENIVVTSDYRHYYIRVVSPSSIVKYMKITLDGDGLDSNNWFWFDSVEVYDYDENAINLISAENSNFENGKYVVEKWSINGNPIYSTSGFDSYNGKDILKVSYTNNFESENFINVIENLSYRINAFIKAINSGLIYQFRVDWYDLSYNFLSSSTKDVTVNGDTFSECSVIVTAPIDASFMKVVLNGDGNNSLNWFWFDKISIVQVTEHNQFPIVLHYGYEYTLANLPANFAMADIVSGVAIDMAIQEILGNRYFDGSLPIGSDGSNSVDKRLVTLWDELHNHKHDGLIAPRLDARDIDLINPPGITTQNTVEDHIASIGDGQADDYNPHGLSAKNVDLKSDEIPYPNEYTDDILQVKTSIHGQVDLSIADHILEVGTGIPDSRNPHGSDSSDIDHNSETNPDNSFKTIEQALFDRVKDLHGDGVVRGLRIFAEDSNYIKITDGYAYINGKRIRVGNSIIISEVLVETDTNKIFRINGVLVNDIVYITYFHANGYYRWASKAYEENGMVKVEINNGNLIFNYTNIDIISYNNLKIDNNENFEMQLNSVYQEITISNLSGVHDRIDIIVISDNGVISAIKGIEDGKRREPIVPNNNIKIAEVYLNYNGTGTDDITYDDVGDFREKIRDNGNSTTIYSNGTTDINVYKKLQSLETTVYYYKQLFVCAADIGLSLSRMAVETFVDNTNKDEENSSNVRLDDSNIYLGTDDEPVQSLDLVADWRNFGLSGGIGTWVSKTYISEHSLGINNLLDINNSDFENGIVDPTYWDKIGLPVYSTDGSNSYKGLKAIKVSANNSYTTNNYISIIANKSYKVFSYIKAEQINVTCRIKAIWYDAIYSNIGESSVSIITNNSRYDGYEAVLVAPVGASYLKITLDGDGIDSNNWFWFDSIELIELANIDKVLFFVDDIFNGGNNDIRYYLSNDGSIPTVEAKPNELHTFSTIGSELRVKIEIEPNNNDGNNQPRVHSFALVWGIGQGHNHNGENSSNVLGENPATDNLTILGGLTLIGANFSINDVATLLTYLQPPQPPYIGNNNVDNQELPIDSIINGPSDMRMDLSEFNFIDNAYITNDAVLLNGSSIIPGTEHDGVTALSDPINIYCYIYPANRGYLEVTVNGIILGSLNLTALWADNNYTDRSQAKVNLLPRTLTLQNDYLIGGIHGTNIELTERMTFVPPQTDRPFPYYQTGKCRFVFNPYSWQNRLGVFGEEELGKIRIAHYTDTSKLTLISETISTSIFNDVG